jgi:hypothetical protein
MTFPIPDPSPGEELAASVDEVFLGWWPDDLMDIVRAPLVKGVYVAYAHRDGGKYLPGGDSDD